jgi:AcrR family transcriptional regulator
MIEAPPETIAWTSPRSGETLRVAARQFLELGFAKVSIAALIGEVGGSKRDFYAEFENKEGLFRRVVMGMCEDVLAPLRDLQPGEGPADEALQKIGELFTAHLLKPQVLALQRLVVSESAEHPEFARIFYDQGPRSAHRLVAGLLRDLAERGEVVVACPEMSAILFCDMLVTEFQFRRAAGGDVSAEEIKDRVRAAVGIFLHGVSKIRRLDEGAEHGST